MAKKNDILGEPTKYRAKPKEQLFAFDKSWFLVDLYQINLFVAKLQSTTIVDSAIDNIVLASIKQNIHLPQISTQINLLKTLVILKQDEVITKLKIDLNLTWITLGTSISGCVLCKDQEISKTVDGRLVGIAGASAFNNGYSGLKLFIWDHDYFYKTKKMPQPLANFYGGLSLIEKNNWGFV